MSARVSYFTTASFTPYRASISALFSNAVCADAGVNAGEANAPSTNAAAIKFPFFMFMSMINSQFNKYTIFPRSFVFKSVA